MKVLFAGRYNEADILSGPEKVAKRIFRECSEIYDCAFAEYFFDGNRYSFFKKLFGFETVLKSHNSRIFRTGILKLFFYLFRNNPENIHIITYERFALICFLYKIFSGVNIIYNIHGLIIHEQKTHRGVSFFYKLKNKFSERIFMKYSDKLIFLSDISLKTAQKYYRIDLNKVNIIPNGADAVFHENEKPINNNTGNNLRIVFSGEYLRKEKGLAFFLDALNTLDFPAEVYIISSRDESINLANGKVKIHFTEKMDTKSLSDFYRDKDIFVSASSYEQFSIAAAEAMCAGVIPVVSFESGISEYITEGINGFKFLYGDVKQLVSQLKFLNDNRLKLSKYSENAKKIYSLLSWKVIFSSYKALYR